MSPIYGNQGPVEIASVSATPVSIPFTFAYKWGPGSYAGFTHALVEVKTKDGVVGVGESGYARDWELINDGIAPRLVGADALDLAECERRALPSMTGMITSRDLSLLHAYSGVEMALWDVIGKVTGRSLASLLGGRVRDQVTFSEYFALASSGEDDIESVAERCASAVDDHGAIMFEGKAGVLELHEEVRLVELVREAVGEHMPIRLDANMAWDVPTARRAVASFASLGVTSIEEPVATYAELAQLRSATPMSFSSHQIDLQQAARLGVPDAFVISMNYLGGIRRSVDFVRACAMFGISVWFRSPSTGVGMAAELQMAAALEPMNQPSQNLARWYGDEVIEQGPFVATDGVVQVPEGPGLGITIDPTAVARCAARAASAPLSDPFVYA